MNLFSSSVRLHDWIVWVSGHLCDKNKIVHLPRAVIKGPGMENSPSYYENVVSGYFHRKTEEKKNQNKSLAVWFSAYLSYLPGNLKS